VAAAEQLERKAFEYELLAASAAERAGLAGGDAELVASATAFTVAAIILREVAFALYEEAA
jgi:hypothetical protein